MWLKVLIGLGIVGVGVMALTPAPPKLERMRLEIRRHFTVSGDCHIEFTADANTAPKFWERFTPDLTEMIKLAASIGIDYSEGVASYVAMALFPECDQTKPQSPSFKIVLAAMELRINAIMESQG